MAEYDPLRPRPRSRGRRAGTGLLVVGLVGLVALVAVASVVALGRVGGKKAAPPPPTTTTRAIPPPKPFRIVFPEGFTRVQMGARVKAVAKIAERERHRPVRLDQKAYLAASRSAVVPCFGRKRQKDLEGFLFPATYDFLRGTPSRALVRDQLETFCDQCR